MMLTFLAMLVALAGIAYALRRRRPGAARGALLGAVAWIAVYLTTLVGVSAASEERVLGRHEPKHFCGAYLDCHISVALVDVATAATLADRVAEGMFWVVRVRYDSDAIRAHLSSGTPQAEVIDAAGRRYPRSRGGEAALIALEGAPGPAARTLAPGEFYTTAFVFDLPRDVRRPQLLVTNGFWLDRLVELFLIGDEDSLFHKRTLFRLEPVLS